jgi:hypothetical protein
MSRTTLRAVHAVAPTARPVPPAAHATPRGTR